MTSAINLGSNHPASLPRPGQSPAKGDIASAFATLIDLEAGTRADPTQATATLAATAGNIRVSPVQAEAVKTDDGAAQVLSDLLALLEGIETDLDSDLGIAPQDIEKLQALLTRLEEMIAAGGMPSEADGLSEDALARLAQTLGLAAPDSGELTTAPLEALSALATRIGSALREDQPELAARLTQAAKALDAQSAAIAVALSDAEPTADMRMRLLESETRPNATAAIANADDAQVAAKQASLVADAQARGELSKSAYDAAKDEGAGDRLAARTDAPAQQAKPSGDNPGDGGKGNGAGAGAGQNTAAPAQASAPGQDAETADGLTFTVNQQAPTPAPGAAIRPEAVAYQRPDAQINLPHIAVEISRQIQNGVSRFEIRLNPAELGRIDVRMEMDQSGNVIARLAVERSETLDLLQRDQRALERALADAGLDPAKTELEFSLHQENGQSAFEERKGWQADSARISENAAAETVSPVRQDIYRGYARLDAVNLWV